MTMHDELKAMVEALREGDLMAAVGIADALAELEDPREAEARRWANLIIRSESSFTIFVSVGSLLSLFAAKPTQEQGS